MSFSDEGIELDISNQCVLIGSNNTGKSNLLRYLLELTTLNMGPLFTPEAKRKWENTIVTRDKRWQFVETNVIKAQILIEYKISNVKKFRWFSLVHTNGFNSYSLSRSYSRRCAPPKKYIHNNDLLTFLFFRRMLDSLRYLTTHRNPYTIKSLTNLNEFDGNETSKMLDWLFHHNDTNNVTIPFTESLKKWMKDLFKEELQFYNIGDENSKIIVETRYGKHDFELKNMGTGVAQTLMILTLCFYYKIRKKDLIMLIEEPETNLHPSALAILYEIIQSEFSNFQVIITTHSNILLDKNFTKWSIMRVIRNNKGLSSIYPCITEKNKLDILDDLGVKASQLLLSNLVIWVEGPSDIYYIRSWINSSKYKHALEESIHYSFAMYGGTNIKNHSIALDKHRSEELVNIINLSKKAIVIFDKDNRNDNNKKDGIKSIIEEAKQNENILLWETEGKEIENYVPKHLMLKVIKLEGIKSKEHLGIEVTPSKNITGKFKSDIGFQSFFKNIYKLDKQDLNQVISNRVSCKICTKTIYGCHGCKDKRKKECNEIKKEVYQKIEEKMVQKKVKIAKAVGFRWTKASYQIKLEKKIEKIIKFIEKANGI